jgi:hypothetical protein
LVHEEEFFDLFVARDDAYALGMPDEKKPWKYRYVKIGEPPTLNVFRKHVLGDHLIGMYCERLSDNHCKWFCFDFDSPKDENDHPVEDGIEVAIAEAKVVHAALESAGLFTYFERSRSGGGVHLWGFIDEWVDADTIVRALDAHLPTERLETLDRGKRYPPVKRSANSVLVALPYAGEAVEFGNSMFFDPDLRTTLTLEQFLSEVQRNKASVIRRLAEDAPVARPATSTSPTTRVEVSGWDGRPQKPITGLVKLFSPYGCGFMRGVLQHQHNGKLVGENEWYAFLGQLTAFENGRAAAHTVFLKHRYYEPRGMDAKFDHACASPPMGCARIHELVRDKPELQCKSCPLTAPYRKAMQPVSALVADSFEPARRATFSGDAERIRRRNSGEEHMGIDLGFPGARGPLTLRPGELMGWGSQPSIGKTAAMVHTTNYVATRGIDVVVFSAETGMNSYHDRLIANEAEVDSLALKRQRYYQGQVQPLSNDEFARVEAAIDRLRAKPIWENYTTTNVERMLDALEGMLLHRNKPWTDPYLMEFDYFQYAQGNDLAAMEEDHVRLAKRSYELKAFTKLTEQGLVVYAQLIRDSEGDNKPKINWWRGTGRFEHDIDRGIIMTGERMPGLYAPRTIHDVKDREGETGWKHDLLLEQTISRFKAKYDQQESATDELAAQGDEFGQWALGGEARE